MLNDRLTEYLYSEICQIQLIDPHSHIDPHKPTSRTLEDILGYHYYTELAHSVGMEKSAIAPQVAPRDRVRAILYQMAQFDNTAQYTWFLEIARAFLNFQGDRISLADCNWLCDNAEKVMARPDYEDWVLQRSNIEKVFLTNDFDDPLTGFNAQRYIPCLRTDDLVFHLDQPQTRERLAKATGLEVGDHKSLMSALGKLFEHFKHKGARACAISLPPNFQPNPHAKTADFEHALTELIKNPHPTDAIRAEVANGVFMRIVEHCKNFKLPFDLMIGVVRRVYPGGVFQGQDLYDQRTSLIQYADLFNNFPDITFCISVLSSVQNQELASYSWIFPNVVTSGHWWYSNIPAYIQQDCRARLQAVPKTKQLGYYSDMYKLEFGLPKYNMYRRILAQILADDFVRTRVYTETQALAMARLLLRDNVRRIFNL